MGSLFAHSLYVYEPILILRSFSWTCGFAKSPARAAQPFPQQKVSEGGRGVRQDKPTPVKKMMDKKAAGQQKLQKWGRVFKPLQPA